MRLSLGMQLGGAIGNLIDRLRFGSVTDLLYVRPFPVFNIADAFIVTGVGLLMIHLWRTSPKQEPKTEAIAQTPTDSPENAESAGNK